MYRVTVVASKELRAIPGVRNFGAHIGRALVADEVVGIDFTENWISIDPKVDYDDALAAVQETVAGYPGIYRDVQTYLRERVKEVLTGKSADRRAHLRPGACRCSAKDAKVVSRRIGDTRVSSTLHKEPLVDIPQVQITVDLAKARQSGSSRAT